MHLSILSGSGGHDLWCEVLWNLPSERNGNGLIVLTQKPVQGSVDFVNMYNTFSLGVSMSFR